MEFKALETILNLQKKVDMYERAFLDLAITIHSDKPMIIPELGDEVVSTVFRDVFELREFHQRNTIKDVITSNNKEEPEPEPVIFTVQKGQTNCDACKFKSLCYDANIELVHLLKCNVYDLNSITEVERKK